MKLTKKEMRKMLAECRIVLGFDADDVHVDIPQHIAHLKVAAVDRRERVRKLEQAARDAMNAAVVEYERQVGEGYAPKKVPYRTVRKL